MSAYYSDMHEFVMALMCIAEACTNLVALLGLRPCAGLVVFLWRAPPTWTFFKAVSVVLLSYFFHLTHTYVDRYLQQCQDHGLHQGGGAGKGCPNEGFAFVLLHSLCCLCCSRQACMPQRASICSSCCKDTCLSRCNARAGACAA